MRQKRAALDEETSCRAARCGSQGACDGVEEALNLRAEQRNRRDAHNGDQADQQPVLDECLSALITSRNTSGESLHERDESVEHVLFHLPSSTCCASWLVFGREGTPSVLSLR